MAVQGRLAGLEQASEDLAQPNAAWVLKIRPLVAEARRVLAEHPDFSDLVFLHNQIETTWAMLFEELPRLADVGGQLEAALQKLERVQSMTGASRETVRTNLQQALSRVQTSERRLLRSNLHQVKAGDALVHLVGPHDPHDPPYMRTSYRVERVDKADGRVTGLHLKREHLLDPSRDGQVLDLVPKDWEGDDTWQYGGWPTPAPGGLEETWAVRVGDLFNRYEAHATSAAMQQLLGSAKVASAPLLEPLAGIREALKAGDREAVRAQLTDFLAAVHTALSGTDFERSLTSYLQAAVQLAAENLVDYRTRLEGESTKALAALATREFQVLSREQRQAALGEKAELPAEAMTKPAQLRDLLIAMRVARDAAQAGSAAGLEEGIVAYHALNETVRKLEPGLQALHEASQIPEGAEGRPVVAVRGLRLFDAIETPDGRRRAENFLAAVNVLPAFGDLRLEALEELESIPGDLTITPNMWFLVDTSSAIDRVQQLLKGQRAPLISFINRSREPEDVMRDALRQQGIELPLGPLRIRVTPDKTTAYIFA